MKKLSKARNEALLIALDNEWRKHRREHGDEDRNTRLRNCASHSTLNALESKGLTSGRETFGVGRTKYNALLSDTGRKVAIDLLHEGAFKEIESELEYRIREDERIKAGNRIKRWILRDYDLQGWEVEVEAHYRLRDMSLRYSIDLAQKCDGGIYDLVSIGWSLDEYTVDISGISLTASAAERMGELMLIGAQIVESGILEDKPVAVNVSATRPAQIHTRCQASQYAK